MHTLPLRHPLDDTGLPHTGPVLPTTTTPAPAPTAAAPAAIARFHHPHFRGVTAGQYDDLVFSFAPFTGAEDRPQMPACPDLSWEDFKVLDRQYESAEILWAQARLRRQIAPLLPRAAGLWAAWITARTQLAATFDQFWRTNDGAWRAQLLRLTDAEASVRAAAEAWDTVAEKLAQVADDQHAITGWDHELPLTTAAKDRGYDATDWAIEPVSQYSHPLPQYDVVSNGERRWGRATPQVAAAEQLIESQRERLREVATLAGDTDRSPVG